MTKGQVFRQGTEEVFGRIKTHTNGFCSIKGSASDISYCLYEIFTMPKTSFFFFRGTCLYSSIAIINYALGRTNFVVSDKEAPCTWSEFV